jgi:hypothetical protein
MKTPTILLVAALIVIGAFALDHDLTEAASPTQFVNLGAGATTTGSIAVTTSTRVMATTTSPNGLYQRIYATICNPNANPVHLSLNNDKPANLSNTTFVIAAAAGYNACYEITDVNGYNGSITASSTNQTATTITWSEYVY